MQFLNEIVWLQIFNLPDLSVGIVIVCMTHLI